MGRLFGARRYALICALVTAVGGLLAARIALGTPYNAHPDEFSHVDAFCYFESQAWLPPPNLNGLNYGPEGDSRIYDNEVVYWVYGRAGAGLARLTGRAPGQPAGANAALSPPQFLPIVQAGNPLTANLARCATHYPVYRLFNVGLFLVTLGVLFGVGLRQAWAAAIGLVLLCLPQVIYVYAYANSDAWALSFALFLIVFALAERRPLASFSKAALLGLLTGVVLLSKQTVWPAIPFAYLLIGYNAAQDWRSAQGERRSIFWGWAAILLATTILVIAPMRIWYPLSQGGGLGAQLAQMREERASPGFKPSHPFAAGFNLGSKGVGLDQVALNRFWVTTTARSFYGYFGYLTTPAPMWCYWMALALGSLNALLTLAVVRRNGPALPGTLRLALAAAPCMVGVCVAASLYNSWTHDFQPQGRYLFVAVVPIALWMWGTWPWDGPRLRIFRLVSAAALLGLCVYVLRYGIFVNPAFKV
jgi:hypothetical protein